MKPREPSLVGKRFKDDNGKPRNGVFFINEDNKDLPGFSISTVYHFKNGKLDGNPAVNYPDGLMEKWIDGQYMGISSFCSFKN